MTQLKTKIIEEWKDVFGYEGLYQISNIGRLKRLSTKRNRSEIIKSVMPNKRRYCNTSLSKDGHKTPISIHRLVALHFVPNPENKEQVNHIDGNPSNNCVSNLEWVTQSENIRHADKIGLRKMPTGFYAPQSKRAFCTKTGKVYGCIKDAAIEVGYSPEYLRQMMSGLYKNKTSIIYYENQDNKL